MKTSGHLIFYISENEDFDLWKVLSQISPDDRAAFIKSALKSALTQGNDSRQTMNWTKQNNVFRMEKGGADGPAVDLAMEELSYHTLAAAEEKIKPLKFLTNEMKNSPRESNHTFSKQVSSADDDSFSLINLNDLELYPDSEKNNNRPLPGLDFLLNNVIGEEDDEKVIDFIRKNKS